MFLRNTQEPSKPTLWNISELQHYLPAINMYSTYSLTPLEKIVCHLKLTLINIDTKQVTQVFKFLNWK